jgi:hypothetical protein
MSTKFTNPKENAVLHFFNDVREYVERCFGVDDIEARYARQLGTHANAKNANTKSGEKDPPVTKD